MAVGSLRITGIALAALTLLTVDTYFVATSRSQVVTIERAVDEFRDGSGDTQDADEHAVSVPEAGPGDPDPNGTSGRDSAEGEASVTPPQAGSGQSDAGTGPAVGPPASSADEPSEPAQGGEEATDTGWTPPREGVYVYSSSGFESVNVPGGRREMPPEAAATVRHRAGGFSTELRPYEEHVDVFENSYEGSAIRSDSWYIERTFAGQKSSQKWVCPSSEPMHIRGARVGRVGRQVCTWETRARTEGTYTLRGYEAITLGDGTRVVNAPHVVIDNTTSGESEGRAVIHLWLHPDTGLVLRDIRDITSETPSPVGRVTYIEQTEFVLRSLTPQR